LTLPADLAGLSRKLKERIETLLEGVGIDKQAKQYPAHKCSLIHFCLYFENEELFLEFSK
jgi:hypothetical protein